MRKSVAYFKKVLAAMPRFESPEWTEFPIGAPALCLHGKQGRGKYRPNGVPIVNAKGVKKLFEGGRRRKPGVSGLHEVHPGAWSFTLQDPNGNELSFYGSP